MRRCRVSPSTWFFGVAVLLWVHAVAALGAEIPARLTGPWQLQQGDEIVLIENDRVVVWRRGQLRVLNLLGYENGLLTVRRSGLIERWGVALEESGLVLEQAGEKRLFQRLGSVPESVRLDPLPLGALRSLTPEKVAAIQADLSDRLKKDQEALKSKTLREEEADSIIKENSRYLRELVQEIGWIDSGRFGSKTSYAAVVLAKHGGDLRLLLAALPLIEKDFKHAGEDAQAFAIIFDTVQLDLGRKQRFGTQIRGVGEGRPFVVPLEDLGKVDEFRKEIGLAPLAQYLADAEKVLEMKISMPPAEEAQPPAAGQKADSVPQPVHNR